VNTGTTNQHLPPEPADPQRRSLLRHIRPIFLEYYGDPVLLRRNIAIDAETAQLVAAAVQAALQTGAPSRPPRRGPRVPPAGCEPLF